MTLVPNHLLPSNGNKSPLLALIFLIICSTSACDLVKPLTDGNESTNNQNEETEQEELDPIQSRRVYDPNTGTYVVVQNAPTKKMDTITWRVQSEERFPPIIEDGSGAYTPAPGVVVPTDPGGGPVTQVGTGDFGSRKLSSYQIDFLLPFLANRYNGIDNEIDANSQWALHFYSGAQIALDELRAENHDLRVFAQDTEANQNKVGLQLRQPAFRDAQLIIGPYLGPNVTLAANAARNREQVIVSPFAASPNLSTTNENYIQVNPTLQTHCREIMRHALTGQTVDQIYLVSGPSQEQLVPVQMLQEAYLEFVGDQQEQTPALPTFTLEATENIDVEPYLAARNVIFILPEYANETLVSNFLRQIYNATRDGYTQVAVYGLPQWKGFSRIDLDYYEGCNVHISSSVFVDNLQPATRAFRRKFFDRFQVVPRDEAFLGYDMTLYFARMLREHGTRFQYALEREAERMLHTEFRFEPVYLPQNDVDRLNNERRIIDRWENRFVHILRFSQFQFNRVN
ncbi:MAG: ABC transporter substrate-binding protein [Bacteroidota bacterium]